MKVRWGLLGIPITVLLIHISGVLADNGKPFGMDKREKWTTSRVVGSPDPPPKYRLIRAFDKFVFKEPVCIAQDPTSDRFMVAEYTPGKIYSFRPDDPTGAKDLFLDMKRGISAFSFHPKYSENGYVFVFSHLDPKVKGPQLSRVSRFQLEPGSNPPHLRPESETIIVEWPARGHNGGEAKIGPDGYLYITTGDGTSGSDPNGTGQSMDDLLAAMMRLDVEHPDPGRNYSIPKDNPFISLAGARPEVWAYGFRNPWRFSFDPHTGQPWVGDVGQDLWEMIELVERGSNHGWSVMEGTHPFHPNSKRGPTPFVPPVIEHHHTEARSITGGYVYQGARARAATQGAAKLAVHELLAEHSTVYLFAEAKSRLGPLMSALAGYIAREAKRIAAERPGGRLDPGLRLVLDEVANICPVPLPEWTSDFGSHGISIIAAFQSRAQMVGRWGQAGARAIANNTGATILHAYGSDTEDLEHWVKLSGHRDELTPGGVRRVPVLTLAQLRELPRGTVVVFPPETSPTVGRMRPGWRRWDLRRQLKAEGVAARVIVEAMELELVEAADERDPVPAGDR